MPVSVPNPYTGKDEETCSVSFAAQQSMAGGVGSPQTESQFNTSKQLGEWGVIKAKYAKGQLFGGLKILTFNNTETGARGYLYISKEGNVQRRIYNSEGKLLSDQPTNMATGEAIIMSPKYKTAIPQGVGVEKPKTEKEPASPKVVYPTLISSNPPTFKSLKEAGLDQPGSEFLYHGPTAKDNGFTGIHVKVEGNTGYPANPQALKLVEVTTGDKVTQQLSSSAKWSMSPIDQAKAPKVKVDIGATSAPVPAPAVSTGSDSVGSMSHEDVAAMFVKIKDDLAKEKGLNVKGANPALDLEVYKAIGEATGYKSYEVKAKIDAYKADGNKLSALKKKVLSGTKQVPTGKAPQKAAAPSKPLLPTPEAHKPDPKPNGVPTVATAGVTNAAKVEVKKVAAADPGKVYNDEDIAAQYIIAKDKVVAASNGKWTLYSKNDELDMEIAIQVGLKTGLNPGQQKVAIANYLASGKKLSTLKKQLAKQGAFTPEADTLKKSGTDKTLADKAKDVNAKADAGYTPTPTPTTGKPPVDTGKAMPKAAAAKSQESGDLSKVSPAQKQLAYLIFKQQGSSAYLSASNESTYDALVAVKATLPDLSLLQLLRAIDEEGAKKFKANNEKLFEKKTATWLTTPEGARHIQDYEKKKAAQAAKEAKIAAEKLEVEKAAKALEANQPPLPADSAQYEPWELEKAKRISKTWLDAKPWTTREQRDLKHYTGSAYNEMNTYLRKGGSSSISERSKNAIEGASSGMRPTTEPILVRRGTGLGQFSSLGIKHGDKTNVWGITGKTFKDEGFLSTSAGGHAAFGGEAKLEIECPVGTPMAYVAPISNFPSENEMLLQAGLEYKVLNIRKDNSGIFIIRLRVVNWPGKVN